MLILITVLLTILLIAAGFAIVLLYKAGIRHLEENELLKEWIIDFKHDTEKTYNTIKNLDNQNIFQKDDEVGVVFQEIVDTIKKLNDRTQEGE